MIEKHTCLIPYQEAEMRTAKNHRKRHLPPGPCGLWFQSHQQLQSTNTPLAGRSTGSSRKRQSVSGGTGNRSGSSQDVNSNGAEGASSSSMGSSQILQQQLNQDQDQDDDDHAGTKGSPGEDVSFSPAWSSMQLSLDIVTPYLPPTWNTARAASKRYRILRPYLQKHYAMIWEVARGQHDFRLRDGVKLPVLIRSVQTQTNIWTVQLQDDSGFPIQAWIEPAFVRSQLQVPPDQNIIRQGVVWMLKDVPIMIVPNEKEELLERMLLISHDSVVQVWTPEQTSSVHQEKHQNTPGSQNHSNLNDSTMSQLSPGTHQNNDFWQWMRRRKAIRVDPALMDGTQDGGETFNVSTQGDQDGSDRSDSGDSQSDSDAGSASEANGRHDQNDTEAPATTAAASHSQVGEAQLQNEVDVTSVRDDGFPNTITRQIRSQRSHATVPSSLSQSGCHFPSQSQSQPQQQSQSQSPRHSQSQSPSPSRPRVLPHEAANVPQREGIAQRTGQSQQPPQAQPEANAQTHHQRTSSSQNGNRGCHNTAQGPLQRPFNSYSQSGPAAPAQGDGRESAVARSQTLVGPQNRGAGQQSDNSASGTADDDQHGPRNGDRVQRTDNELLSQQDSVCRQLEFDSSQESKKDGNRTNGAPQRASANTNSTVAGRFSQFANAQRSQPSQHAASTKSAAERQTVMPRDGETFPATTDANVVDGGGTQKVFDATPNQTSTQTGRDVDDGEAPKPSDAAVGNTSLNPKSTQEHTNANSNANASHASLPDGRQSQGHDLSLAASEDSVDASHAASGTQHNKQVKASSNSFWNSVDDDAIDALYDDDDDDDEDDDAYDDGNKNMNGNNDHNESIGNLRDRSDIDHQGDQLEHHRMATADVNERGGEDNGNGIDQNDQSSAMSTAKENDAEAEMKEDATPAAPSLFFANSFQDMDMAVFDEDDDED